MNVDGEISTIFAGNATNGAIVHTLMAGKPKSMVRFFVTQSDNQVLRIRNLICSVYLYNTSIHLPVSYQALLNLFRTVPQAENTSVDLMETEMDTMFIGNQVAISHRHEMGEETIWIFLENLKVTMTTSNG